MLSFSNYENFETHDLKNYLNDNKDHNNNIAELQTEQAKYLFTPNNLGDTYTKPINEQAYKPNNQNQNYTNKLSQKYENLDGTLEKLNHIIHLLEQQQDEKTETVTEELIMYLFLGFFIIYIIDSFFRAGKYYR
jgi:hypothetical protein